MLRDAVSEELERRAIVSETLKETDEFLLDVEDGEGRGYKARLVGRVIAGDDDWSVYLTADERVILYEHDPGRYWEIGDAKTELENLPEGVYIDAMRALGLEVVIDI